VRRTDLIGSEGSVHHVGTLARRATDTFLSEHGKRNVLGETARKLFGL
jgi:hypothetical protein